jgi:hypothetical protein
MSLLAYNSCTGGYVVIFTCVFKIYLSWIGFTFSIVLSLPPHPLLE